MSNEVVAALNEAIRIEHTLALQCHQSALTVRGLWRLTLVPFLDELGDEARSHARKFGEKVVALGGTPAARIDEIESTSSASAIVEGVLEMERAAMVCYRRALECVPEADVALRTMIEDHIEAEQRHIEEIELLVEDTATRAEIAPAEGAIRRAS